MTNSSDYFLFEMFYIRITRITRNMSKRIALFTGNYNHIADGVSLTLNRLVRYLESQGSEVLVIAPTIEHPPMEHAGRLVPVPSIPMPIPNRHEYRVSVMFPRSVRAEVRKFKPDLIHIATPDVVGKGALKFAQKYDIPVVASYHTHFASYMDYYHLGWTVAPMWRMFKKFYDQCMHVYVPSESMAEVLREHGITRGLKIWERGIELDKFSPTKRDLTWRRNLGIADDEKVITFVSRLVWEKGLREFCDVVQRLEREGIRHKSLVVGSGAAEDQLRAELPNTIFTGKLFGEALATSYASSDIFLFPSETETFGNVTLEAMASGLPTVCANATGSKELVAHGKTGFLAKGQDANDFYQCVKTLLDDENLYQNMSAAAVERAKLYNWDTILAKIDGYYDLALREHEQRKVNGE